MRSPAEFDRVLALADKHNKCEISRITGIPRSTVSGWLNGRAPRFGVDRTRGGTCLRCGDLRHPFPQLIDFQYAYLLGLYLGDGCLPRHPRGVYRLHVFLDSAYPIIAAEREAAMSLVMPASRASCLRHPRYNMLGVSSYSKHWPRLFPQHGPGVKHKRRIEHLPRYLRSAGRRLAAGRPLERLRRSSGGGRDHGSTRRTEALNPHRLPRGRCGSTTSTAARSALMGSG